MSFRLTERDLDLIQLEELHASSGYVDWFCGRIGLGDWTLEAARQSVWELVDGEWGESDLVIELRRGEERTVVLIEDKLAAAFTDRQALRYHDRGRALVASGGCQGYLTVLVAPASYLKAVPADDAWHCKIAVEEIAAWFRAMAGSHATWRARALDSALQRSQHNVSPDNAEVVNFSAALAAYLAKHYAQDLSHKPGKDRNGPNLRFPGASATKTLWWKYATNQMLMLLGGEYVGIAETLSLQPGIGLEKGADFGRKSDYLTVAVPPVDLASGFDDQLQTVDAAIQAALKLIALIPSLDALASSGRTMS